MLFVSILIQIGAAANYSQTNQQRLGTNSSQNVTISQYNQEMWLVNIGIGYPTQYFTVQVDSGSNILWVPSTSCRSCEITTQYNPRGQTYYKPNGSTYSQEYGSGECSGVVASDIVSITGSSINTTFLMMFATYEADFPNFPGFDGIMGLSNDPQFLNLFQQSYQAKQISSELYSIVLNPDPLNSYLMYGNIATELVNAAVWVTPNDDTRWVFDILDFSINGVSYTADIGDFPNALMDTGTSCLLLYTSLYDIVLNDYLIPGGCKVTITGEINCPCYPTNYDKFPNITTTLNGFTFTIPYMNLLVDYYTSVSGDTCTACLSTISGETFMVYGDPALQSFIPIFNKTANKVGFIQ